MDSKKRRNILIAILIFSAALRLFGLSRGDTVNDEVFMSFRGLGMVDFDEAEHQTTPLEWFDPVRQVQPWWTHLSFHDHPPLVFATEGIFMKVFGESAWAFRLPSALLGIVSVYLVYLMGSILFSSGVGFLSSALYAVTLNSVYISRTGMQESYVIFFILLCSYFFLKSFKQDKYLIWTGVALGFGLLAKYTVFIVAPIFLIYLLFFRRDYFSNKNLWLGILLAVLIFSPVMVYNWQLYRAVGHFDFQFSYIFGQHPKEWQVAPGKDIGTLVKRFENFVPRLINSNSWVFLSLFGVGILSFGLKLFKEPKTIIKKYSFLLIAFIFLLLLIMKIGPSYRFLTMLAPFMALIAGVFLNWFFEKYSWHSWSLVLALFAILLFEVFYSWNNQIAYYPWPRANAERFDPWFFSKVRYDNYNWGYNELGNYLDKELYGKMPAITFDMKYKFLENLRDKTLEKDKNNFKESYPALIVYYGNFDEAAKLWILDRLNIYHGWPIVSLETYYSYLKDNGFDYFDRVGFRNYYFILQNNAVLDSASASASLMRGEEVLIKNKRGEEVFKIYKYSVE